MRSQLPALSAFELMWEDFMEAAIDVGRLKPPFGQAHPVYALVETLDASSDQGRLALEGCLEQALESGLIADVVVVQSIEDSNRLWGYREAIGELLARLKPHAAFDVGVPMASMGSLVSRVRADLGVSFPDQRHLFFGHLGDGILHVLSGPYGEAAAMHTVEALVYAAVSDAGGCISGEHGIGVIKREFFHLSRSQQELDMMRDLKRLLDPAGILNPGRVYQ